MRFISLSYRDNFAWWNDPRQAAFLIRAYDEIARWREPGGDSYFSVRCVFGSSALEHMEAATIHFNQNRDNAPYSS